MQGVRLWGLEAWRRAVSTPPLPWRVWSQWSSRRMTSFAVTSPVTSAPATPSWKWAALCRRQAGEFHNGFWSVELVYSNWEKMGSPSRLSMNNVADPDRNSCELLDLDPTSMCSKIYLFRSQKRKAFWGTVPMKQNKCFFKIASFAIYYRNIRFHKYYSKIYLLISCQMPTSSLE